jgi:soluble cytochrome b562
MRVLLLSLALARPSLVRYDMSGRLRRLDGPPEEAALEVIRLTPDEKAQVDHVLTQRAAAVDRVVADNLELLLKTQLARDANDYKGLRDHLVELMDKFKTVRDRGSLKDEIAYVLSDEHASTFRDMVDEYWKAILRDELKDRQNEAQGPRGRAILARETALSFGQEIRRSYDRQIQAKTAQLEDFLSTLSATPEQEEKVRKITADAFQASAGKPTLQQRRETFTKILRVLTPEQRRTVLERLYADAPR